MGAWRQAGQLARHANGLSVEGQPVRQLRAIEESRSLLEEPDPVMPVIDQLTTALRRELDARWRDYQARLAEGIASIESSADWAGVDEGTRAQLRTSVGLGHIEAPRFGTTEELLSALDSRSLDDWRAMTDAIGQRVNALREELVRRKSPNVVRLRPVLTTIRTQEELESYLKQLRDEIEAHIRAGRPVVL